MFSAIAHVGAYDVTRRHAQVIHHLVRLFEELFELATEYVQQRIIALVQREAEVIGLAISDLRFDDIRRIKAPSSKPSSGSSSKPASGSLDVSGETTVATSSTATGALAPRRALAPQPHPRHQRGRRGPPPRRAAFARSKRDQRVVVVIKEPVQIEAVVALYRLRRVTRAAARASPSTTIVAARSRSSSLTPTSSTEAAGSASSSPKRSSRSTSPPASPPSLCPGRG